MSEIPEEIQDRIDNDLSEMQQKLVELWHLYEEYYTDLVNYKPNHNHPSASLQEHAENKFETYIVQLSNSYMSKEQIEADIERETTKFHVEKMSVAIQDNNLEEVKRLYTINYRIIFEKDSQRDTAILRTARHCDATQIIEFLLEKGANVEDLDVIHQTPLIIASQNGCANLVHLLLKAGANVHHTGDYNISALITAADEGHTEIVRMLLKNGANPELTNGDDETPLMLALKHNRNKPSELTELLSTRGNAKGKANKKKSNKKKSNKKKSNKKKSNKKMKNKKTNKNNKI